MASQIQSKVSREDQQYVRTGKQSYADHTLDWQLFMWFASSKKVEYLINLFIVIWDATPSRYHGFFTSETSEMIGFIEDLASSKAISNENKEKYSKTLKDYSKFRNRQIVNTAWIGLKQNCDLTKFSRAVEKQIRDCPHDQKFYLRKMIKSRMESFCYYAKGTNEKIEKGTKGVSNKLPEQEKEIESFDCDRNGQCTTNNVDNVIDESSKIAQVMDIGRDDNENNPRQLVKDIENLNRVLDRFTGVKRIAKEIHSDAVTELFTSLKCATKVHDKQMKLILGAALQQHLIKFILKFADDNYFKQAQENITDDNDDKLEAAIQFKTEELTKLTTRFEETRQEMESRILTTILRQQSYAALGNRGFPLDHPFVKKLVNELTDEMNKYRTIDEERIKSFEVDISTIIVKILQIFHFRLKTQEPIACLKFYDSGEDIDPNFMDGMWEGHHEDYVVEICSFPAVFVESDERVYTKAQVIVRYR